MRRNREDSSFRRVSRWEDRREKDMETYEKMKEELEAYNEQGITLRLSGRRSSSSKIAHTCCIRECGSYMGDYVLDDQGKLVEICFDKVRKY